MPIKRTKERVTVKPAARTKSVSKGRSFPLHNSSYTGSAGHARLFSQAKRRSAERRLDEIAQLRQAHALQARGLATASIAKKMHVTAAHAERLLRAAEVADVTEVTPEELILKAVLQRFQRRYLLRRLETFPYTFATAAPAPFEGTRPGTWDQVVLGYHSGLLDEQEFLAIKRAVRPPGA